MQRFVTLSHNPNQTEETILEAFRQLGTDPEPETPTLQPIGRQAQPTKGGPTSVQLPNPDQTKTQPTFLTPQAKQLVTDLQDDRLRILSMKAETAARGGQTMTADFMVEEMRYLMYGYVPDLDQIVLGKSETD